MKVFEPLYDRAMRWAAHPHAPRYLAAVSFAESSFFPVPPDVMLAPMTVAEPAKGLRFATLTTLASVTGGIFGYLIGWLAFDLIEPWLKTSHYWPSFLQARDWFDRWGVWVIFIAAFSPIPYKVFTIAAGTLSMALLPFVITSFVGRGARFYLVALTIIWLGPRLEPLARRYIEWLGWICAVFLIVLIVWLQLHDG